MKIFNQFEKWNRTEWLTAKSLVIMQIYGVAYIAVAQTVISTIYKTSPFTATVYLVAVFSSLWFLGKATIMIVENLDGIGNLSHAPMFLQKNKYFVMRAVRYTGENLRYASEELKDDIEVVRRAVMADKDNSAIEFASPRLQAVCKGNDPIQALDSLHLSIELQSELQVNTSTAKTKRMKI